MLKMLRESFLHQSMSRRRLVVETLVVIVLYWLLATASFKIFRSWGIMPMPVSFPAGLALVFAVLRGGRSAPGIILGTVLANVLVLGAPLAYAMCVGLANCLGAVAGGLLFRQQFLSQRGTFGGRRILFCFFITVVIPPVVSASGGMSCKWLLGLVPYGQFFIGWMRWATAHATGILLIALPVLAWLSIKDLGK